MIVHEKGFKFHVQPQTGAYFCLTLLSQIMMRTMMQKLTRI